PDAGCPSREDGGSFGQQARLDQVEALAVRLQDRRSFYCKKWKEAKDKYEEETGAIGDGGPRQLDGGYESEKVVLDELQQWSNRVYFRLLRYKGVEELFLALEETKASFKDIIRRVPDFGTRLARMQTYYHYREN